jgi:hypothetical protein
MYIKNLVGNAQGKKLLEEPGEYEEKLMLSLGLIN